MNVKLAPLLVTLVPLLTACTGDDPVDPGRCEPGGQTVGAVVTRVTFARQLDDTTAEGIDLDAHTSVEGDEPGCFQQDFVSPDGRPGIDNQFATLLPIIEEFVGSENIDALLEGAIANGQLLIMVAVQGVDDPMNDDCVDIRVGAGTGTPFLDTEGNYVAYQTFGFDESETPSSLLGRGRIEDGVLEAGPGRLVLPVKILDADFNLDLQSSRVRLEVTPDPEGGGMSLSGYMSGGIRVEDFKDIVTGLTIGSDVVGAVVPVVSSLSDLGMNDQGICEAVSAAMKFETTPAFFYETTP